MITRTKQNYDGQPKMKMVFSTVIHDNGKFVALPQPLIKFMGISNAVFLIGIMDHYNHLAKRRKVKEGKLFYDATIFKSTWDISLYQQNKAIKELSSCGLLKETGKTYRNRKTLRINIINCCCITGEKYKHALPGRLLK